MGLYTFKQVPASEKDKLVSFIDGHWKKGHALVKSNALLDFQHYNKENDSYNFIVAENIETEEYDALVGFIPLAQYDSSLKEEGNYWGAIWKYREDVKNEEINAAAFYVWKRLFKLPYFQSYAAIGISEIARQIYIASRMNLGSLSQYYLLNDSISNFKIAGNVSREFFEMIPGQSLPDYSAKWISLDEVPNNLKHTYKPVKSLVYFKQRYGSHPIYSYRFIGLFREDKLIAVLAARIVEAAGSKCIRIMDVLGKLEGSIFDSFIHILYSENCEYIDIMNYGIPENVFTDLGFRKLDPDGSLIIPNYFEPFDQCNVKINLAYKAKFDGYVAFKGDSDQDRPNIL